MKRRFIDTQTSDDMITSLAPQKKSRRTLRRRAARISRRIANLVATREDKYLDTAVANTSVTNTPVVVALTDIAQGDNYYNRNGNLVQSKYLQCEFTVNQLAGTTPINFKVALVLDRQPNGIGPTFQNVYDTSVAPLTFSLKNIQAYQERFVILKEWLGVTTGANGGDGMQSCVKGYINLRKLSQADQIVRWSGSGAVAPNVNGYYLLYVSSTSTVNQVELRGCFRYVFNEN